MRKSKPRTAPSTSTARRFSTWSARSWTGARTISLPASCSTTPTPRARAVAARALRFSRLSGTGTQLRELPKRDRGDWALFDRLRFQRRQMRDPAFVEHRTIANAIAQLGKSDAIEFVPHLGALGGPDEAK